MDKTDPPLTPPQRFTAFAGSLLAKGVQPWPKGNTKVERRKQNLYNPHTGEIEYKRRPGHENCVTCKKGYHYEHKPEIAEDEIKGNDRPEKCPDCGMMHARSVPCPKKKLLDELGEAECEHCGEDVPDGEPHHCWQSGHQPQKVDENFTLSKLGTNHPKGSFEYFHKPSKTKYTMTHAGVKDGRTYWKSANAVGSHGHRDDVRRLHSSIGEAEMAEGQKKYDRDADIRAIARERVGQVPGRKVILSKKDKKPKHKADLFKENEGE